jgi:hypothetical protein
VRFLGLEVTHPQAAALARRVRVPGVSYRTGPGPQLRARLDTPRGPVIL